MKVSSYISVGGELQSVEVELSLTPGLPQFHFLGLADTALKESTLRIRSALREQGFQLPQTFQVLIHLRPMHLRKTSKGLDLAVAAALLWETEQIPRPIGPEPPTLYGELTLKGAVHCPDDLEDIWVAPPSGVFTGRSNKGLSFQTRQLKELKDIAAPVLVEAHQDERRWLRPLPQVRRFSREAAEVAEVVAAGEHAALFLGPAGSGKSTLAGAIPGWIEEPDTDEIKEVARLWREMRNELKWRPILKPHHSITPLAMIGGGASLWPGEITRAHGGVLIMDELLQFHKEIQESLREPVENGAISLVRAGGTKTYPARLLLLATANLCDCGKFVPRKSIGTCKCSRRVRQKTLSRLTGPFVDRFAIVALTDEWISGERDEVSSKDIFSRVQNGIRFRKETRKQTVANSRLMPEVIEEGLNDFQRKHLISEGGRSRRRRASVLRVARTLADLRESLTIENQDLENAVRLSFQTHLALEEWC